MITSTANAWIDGDVMKAWVDGVLGVFCFRRSLFLWDTYETHLMPSVDSSLEAIHSLKYIQSPDVCWNKPFKQHCREQYDQWLSEEGLLPTNLTSCGNIKPPPRRTIVQWILESWNKLLSEMIRNSFVSCGLTGSFDGREIHCFKE